MAEKKMTKVEKYNAVITLLKNCGEACDFETQMDEWKEFEAAWLFLEEEVEKLKAKNARKSTTPTPKQLEKINEQNEIIEEITAQLAEAQLENITSLTIKDLQARSEKLSNFSNQKISAMLRKAVETGNITREEIKGKAYFKLAAIAIDPDDE